MAKNRRRSGGGTARRRRPGGGVGVRVLTYLGIAALGAVAALAATDQFRMPDWKAPLARIESMARQTPQTPDRPQSIKVERDRETTTRPDRSIRTAALPVPRPQREVPEKKREAIPALTRPRADVRPLPKTDVPGAPALKPATATRSGRTTRLAGLEVPICGEGSGRACVIDGDTFVLDGKAIRVAGIVVPESGDPRCPREVVLADRARQRLRQLLSTGPVELVAHAQETDIYGRKQRTVMRDGRSVGDTLIAEGLARPAGGAAPNWCR